MLASCRFACSRRAYTSKPPLNLSSKRIGFSFPKQPDNLPNSSVFQLTILEARFKANTFSNKDIHAYLGLFAQSPRIRSKSLALGIDAELYTKYALLFTTLIKNNKIPALNIHEITSKLSDIERCVLPEFYQFLLEEAPEKTRMLDSLINLSDLRSPAAQFEDTRKMKRKFILHTGPTNSGKTYSALKNLEAASSGIYLGPLRLLANEIHERLSATIPCNLITGEQRIVNPSTKHYACTVEMALWNQEFDVAVVDEIQMIGDQQRGFAWTNAVLGLQAKEIHLCGDASANTLIQDLCTLTGDTLEIKVYDRLSPLSVEAKPLKSLTDIQKGDCVITFSRKDIYAVRREIEQVTGLKCASIYGNLPPDVRSEQARLFNKSGSGFDVLVASDAVGMGLNLAIRRVVFDTVEKVTGLVAPTHIKQIAGRAGRFGSDFPEGMDKHDIKYIADCLKSSNAPIESAGLLPTFSQIEAFNEQIPNQTLSKLLEMFEQLAMVDGNFFLCNFENQKRIANLLEYLPLSLYDRFTFVLAPVNAKKTAMDVTCLISFATARAYGKQSHIADAIEIPTAIPKTGDALFSLELIHKSITLYHWLNLRMPDTFCDKDIADLYKFKTEAMIQEALITMTFDRKKRVFGKYAR